MSFQDQAKRYLSQIDKVCLVLISQCCNQCTRSYRCPESFPRYPLFLIFYFYLFFIPTGKNQRITNIYNSQSSKNVSVLNQFETKTGLPRSYAVLGAGALYLLLIIFNFGGIGQLLSNIAGFVIPGYYSLVALKTATTTDDTQLLTYWVVFAFINVIEFWSKTILYWVPFYFLLKTVFLIYLSAFGGANLVYNTVIRPLSDKYIQVDNVAPISSKIQETAEGVSTALHD